MEVIKNPLSIRIPKHTLVLMCGVQNSGKTTFTQKNFPISSIVCSDDIFFETSRESAYKYGETCIISDDKIFNRIINLGKSGETAVYESIAFTNDYRLHVVNMMNKYFSNIIQIVLHPSLDKVLNRPPKPVLEEQKRLSLRPPTRAEIAIFWKIIQANIDTRTIGHGTDTTYILNDIDPNHIYCNFE